MLLLGFAVQDLMPFLIHFSESSSLLSPAACRHAVNPPALTKTITGGDLGILLETHGAASRSPQALLAMAWMDLICHLGGQLIHRIVPGS